MSKAASLPFTYNPETGEMRDIFGKKAHRSGHGYMRLKVFGELHYVHRLAWLYMTGKWPAVHIDHKDMDGENNRWSNLREATHQENLMNRTANKNNTSGMKGVSLDRTNTSNPWRARITINGKEIGLGSYPTKEMAQKAYLEKAGELFGEFARGQ